MAGLVEGDRGGILGLRRYVNDHAEAIAVDLLASGRSIYDIGDTISWFEIKAWIAKPPESSVLLRDIRQAAAEKAAKEAAEKAEQAKPVDARVVGGKPGDAIPINELNTWLGWDDAEGGE